jgi:hypothetical protein
MTLDSRRAWACSETDFSSQNDDRVWGVYYRRTPFWFAFFLGGGTRRLSAKNINKKCFLFTVEVFFALSFLQLSGKRFADDEVETNVRNWVRQQSKDFYATSFDALIKRWEKHIKVDGGYMKKYMFLPPVSNNIYFTFYIHLRHIYWLFPQIFIYLKMRNTTNWFRYIKC